MVTLRVDNSFSRIEGLKTEQFHKLRKLLSYTPDAAGTYFSGGYKPRIKYCIDLKGNFPTGLLKRVLTFLTLTEPGPPEVQFQDIRRNVARSIQTKINDAHALQFKPYFAQLEAVNAAARAKRGIISMPTGTGKSYVIALLIARLGLRTLVVVPSLEIKKQLSEGLLNALESMSGITVENIDSNALKTATEYDCLIVDEAHHVAASTYQRLNKTAWTGIRYRYFFTATPFRNQTEEQLLFEGISGQIIYQLSYKDAVSQKLIVPIEAYYIDLPKQNTDAYTWAQVYSELVVKNDYRNEVIANLAMDLAISGRKILVLVKEVAHGAAISKISGMPFVNGQDESSRMWIERFNSPQVPGLLIGTEGILGEGVDTKPCEYVIIAGLGKAKSAFMQKIGRAARNYPGKETAKIIIFRDSSHKYTLRHFNEQKRILLEEYGVKTIKLDI